MSEDGQKQAETPEDFQGDPRKLRRRWLTELSLAAKTEDKWRKKSEEIIKLYRAGKGKANAFNILYANTDTYRPAIYNSQPKPDVRRRYDDADPVGAAVAQVLDRALQFTIDTCLLDEAVNLCVLDYLLPGRCIARVRYVPSLIESPEGMGDTDDTEEGEHFEELEWESVQVEHVIWDDFRRGPGKTWSEVTWIGFHHELTRDELIEQFGEEIGRKVQLGESRAEAKDQADEEMFSSADVWEIWDKDKKAVVWVSEGFKDGPLKIQPDPLQLKGFFPCARPLYAIDDASSLVPVPLYTLYEEQAKELDRISHRINRITEGMKLRGVYDATCMELGEVLRGDDNDLIPAQSVSAFIDRGGIGNAIWMLPINDAVGVLKQLYDQRELCKQTIYEMIGLSDILRGQSDARETLGAQNLKAQYGGSRIRRMQRDVENWIRDTLRLMAEIISQRFSTDTLAKMTGLQYPTQADLEMQYQQAIMQWQQQAMMAQQQGQEPPEQPQPPQDVTWEVIEQVLRSDLEREFKIDIESESTVAASIEADMEALSTLGSMLGGFMQQVGPMVQQGVLPMDAAKEILLAVVRRAKLGNAVEDALNKMEQPPPPDPSQDPAQQQVMMEQQKLQIEAQKAQMDADAKQKEIELRVYEVQAKAQLDIQVEQLKHQREMEKLKAEVQLKAAEMQAGQQIEAARLQNQRLNDAARVQAQAARMPAGA